MGLTVEHAFLPGLLAVATNPRMRQDEVKECAGPGCVDCSAGLKVLGKPANLSRTEGEQHPQGNPHYNVDPSQGPRMARMAHVVTHFFSDTRWSRTFHLTR